MVFLPGTVTHLMDVEPHYRWLLTIWCARMSPLPSDLVYVVDDDEDVRYSMKILLERAGFAVRDFPHAKAFQADTDGKEAGCLLFDLNLPGMSGLELLQRLRDRGVQVPAIILSGNSLSINSDLTAANVFHVLPKPTPAKDLLSWVAKACARAKYAAEGPG